AAVARQVAAGIRANKLRQYVLDPVLRASSGDPLSDKKLLAIVRDELVPLAVLITPNMEEAGALLGERVNSLADAERAAEKLVREVGASAALVTGGHQQGGAVVDVLFADGIRHFRAKRIVSTNTHGTGCTLSAAITA